MAAPTGGARGGRWRPMAADKFRNSVVDYRFVEA